MAIGNTIEDFNGAIIYEWVILKIDMFDDTRGYPVDPYRPGMPRHAQALAPAEADESHHTRGPVVMLGFHQPWAFTMKKTEI